MYSCNLGKWYFIGVYLVTLHVPTLLLYCYGIVTEAHFGIATKNMKQVSSIIFHGDDEKRMMALVFVFIRFLFFRHASAVITKHE